MRPTQPQPDDGAGEGGEEMFGDPTKFHNWAGTGAADLILPKISSDSQ